MVLLTQIYTCNQRTLSLLNCGKNILITVRILPH